MNQKALLDLAKEHGTPLFVVDHAELRKNYATFKKHFPRVQAYYAVKVNSDPAIVQTFYELGGSFDVASMQEFHTVYQFIRKLPAKARQDFIWDKVIYANPIKPIETLLELDRYRPLVTYDNVEEVKKIAKPYLGRFISVQSDWTPLRYYSNAFHGFNRPAIDPADPWQFKNFLLTDGD